MDFTQWKFRASQMGQLMAGVKDALTERQTETLEGLLTKQAQNKITDRQLQTLGDLIAKRDAKPKLLKTATNLLDEIFQEVVFGRSKEIKTKYMDKGLAKEEESLTLYTQVTGNLLLKNETNFQNDHFTGTPDNTQGLIRDIKTCWDYSTYPMHQTEIKKKAYLCQLNVYMDLCGLDEAELVYCLVDTPFSMIDDELRRLSWDIGATSIDSVPKELKVETVQNHIYTEAGLIEYCHQSMDMELDWFTDFKEIRPENRLKIFHTYRDGKLLKQMRTQVELAREYLCNISVNLLKEVA
jgi:hypothetical protein